MIISLEFENRIYKIDVENPIDISIPLRFDGAQPNAFGVEKASSKAVETGNLVGDTRHGGSCNFEQVKFIPHCNGTHTECVGHITNERISVNDCLIDVFIPAILISVVPESARETSDSYVVPFDDEDKVISRRSIENALERFRFQISNFKSSETPKAIVIRTLPNHESKLSQIYLEEFPPYFSTEAMQFLVDLGVNHLLVDLPSIDRIFDEGRLSNHRIFWNIEQGSYEIGGGSLKNNTITELIYAPDSITDGNYLLNLQIAPFEADASPSRPIIFEVLD